jgi:hypothetical protein
MLKQRLINLGDATRDRSAPLETVAIVLEIGRERVRRFEPLTSSSGKRASPRLLKVTKCL